MDFLLEFFGVIGLILLLVGFVINFKTETIKAKIIYNLLTCLGAIILCLYAYVKEIIIFFALEAIWAIIALYFVYSLVKREPKKKLNHKK